MSSLVEFGLYIIYNTACLYMYVIIMFVCDLCTLVCIYICLYVSMFM